MSTQNRKSGEKSENAPVYRLTLGRVQGAVFARANEGGRTHHSAQITAFWKDTGSNTWRTGSSFDAGDLGNVVVVALACVGWIIVKGGQS